MCNAVFLAPTYIVPPPLHWYIVLWCRHQAVLCRGWQVKKPCYCRSCRLICSNSTIIVQIGVKQGKHFVIAKVKELCEKIWAKTTFLNHLNIFTKTHSLYTFFKENKIFKQAAVFAVFSHFVICLAKKMIFPYKVCEISFRILLGKVNNKWKFREMDLDLDAMHGQF